RDLEARVSQALGRRLRGERLRLAGAARGGNHGDEDKRQQAAHRGNPTLHNRPSMEPWSRERAGRLEELELESDALRGNALGDPHVRPLWVSLPPGYDDDAERRYPAIYVLQGLTGQLD